MRWAQGLQAEALPASWSPKFPREMAANANPADSLDRNALCMEEARSLLWTLPDLVPCLEQLARRAASARGRPAGHSPGASGG